MAYTVDCVVIGAGVVGLAVARACAMQGWETILLEAQNAIGTETSSRNSEVIHAGIYYPKGSLKAKLCVHGKNLLYKYCDERGIAYKRCGKLIVATNKGQINSLTNIANNAQANGVNGINRLSASEAKTKEPSLHCLAALESTSTGIIDSHGLMLALQGDFEQANGMLAVCSPMVSGNTQHSDTNGILLTIGGDEPTELIAKRVINSAGLQAVSVANKLKGMPLNTIPKYSFAKGNYYSLIGANPFSRLIYPIPEAGGLGTHLTLDLNGRARFGPDVEWVGSIDYTVNPDRASTFYESIRNYWPELPDNSLTPDYAGIRPKIQTKEGQFADFIIQTHAAHGIAGLVNLYGIESPGLTASLAIAEMVVNGL